MTTVELRTSITEDLDQMSAEMLESVSRYVRRLRRHARPGRRIAFGTTPLKTTSTETVPSDLAMQLTPRVQRFMRGNPWHISDEELDRLRYEYLTEKYK
ncbi:MAG: hypothetical protein IJT19_05865 [Bacteroidaceae bacterium]|nr:hypothetical protein [Bacteroidaceae bacterium]